jgi:hypothetical protein
MGGLCVCLRGCVGVSSSVVMKRCVCVREGEREKFPHARHRPSRSDSRASYPAMFCHSTTTSLNQDDIVKLLIESGASVTCNTAVSPVTTPLHMAVMVCGEFVRCCVCDLKSVRPSGASHAVVFSCVDFCVSPCQYNNPVIVRMLLDAGADVRALNEDST